MNTKRFKVLRELISTEEKYIETLEGVVHHFHRPLKKSGLLSMKDFRTLFCGVDGLLPLQYQLKTDLQEAEVHDTSVGRVFIRFVPFLRMCVHACSASCWGVFDLSSAALTIPLTGTSTTFAAIRCQSSA